MRTDIIEFLEEELKRRCESPNNFFGSDSYYHVKSVVNHAALLAKEYGADLEIVTIAAWLHDIASVTSYDLYKEHHIHGATIAEEILVGMDYPTEKIALVQKCILNHRGTEVRAKCSLEEICVADADAISHFDNFLSLLFLAYDKRKLNFKEGIDFVCNKLNRSYNKLSDRSKIIYKEKYTQVMQILTLPEQ